MLLTQTKTGRRIHFVVKKEDERVSSDARCKREPEEHGLNADVARYNGLITKVKGIAMRHVFCKALTRRLNCSAAPEARST